MAGPKNAQDRAQGVVIEDAVRQLRRDLKLPPSPESDEIWRERIVSGGRTFRECHEALLGEVTLP